MSPLNQIPPPTVIHAEIGRLYRQLALLRRLLRLSQAAFDAGTDGNARRLEQERQYE